MQWRIQNKQEHAVHATDLGICSCTPSTDFRSTALLEVRIFLGWSAAGDGSRKALAIALLGRSSKCYDLMLIS